MCWKPSLVARRSVRGKLASHLARSAVEVKALDDGEEVLSGALIVGVKNEESIKGDRPAAEDESELASRCVHSERRTEWIADFRGRGRCGAATTLRNCRRGRPPHERARDRAALAVHIVVTQRVINCLECLR